jgi:hypothetical protein
VCYLEPFLLLPAESAFKVLVFLYFKQTISLFLDGIDFFRLLLLLLLRLILTPVPVPLSRKTINYFLLFLFCSVSNR